MCFTSAEGSDATKYEQCAKDQGERDRERGQLNVTWNRYQQSREAEDSESSEITNVSKSIQNSAFLAVENVQKKIKEGKRTKLLQEKRKEKQLLVVVVVDSSSSRHNRDGFVFVGAVERVSSGKASAFRSVD